MKRFAGAAFLGVTLISGCVSGPETGGGPPVNYGKGFGPPTVPGVVGPNGTKVPMTAPYDSAAPGSPWQAQRMMANSVPLDSVQVNRPGMFGPGFAPPGAGAPPTMVPPGGVLSPPGMPFAPGVPAGPGIKPVNFLPNGQNPGVVTANLPPGAMSAMNKGGVSPAMYAHFPGPGGAPFTIGRTQVKFTRPTGMKISWFTQGADGKPGFSTTPLETPGRYNFPQAAIYRLKLSNIEGRPGVELYPTLEVVPQNPRTEAFLAHSSVPVEFTNEDFKQVSEGNYIVKVIYLPDPQFQDAAGTGTDEILSTRLEPGADPIQEALRRGSILLVIRMGNVDQEAPNTPPLNAPAPGAKQPQQPQHPPMMGMPGMGRPNVQVPVYGFPGMRPPLPPSNLPQTNPKDAGKATTGLPGGPINVPSLPLTPPVQPGLAGPAPKSPGLPNVPPLPGQYNVPSPGGPGLPGLDVKTPTGTVPPLPSVPAPIKGPKDEVKTTPLPTPMNVPATPTNGKTTGTPPPAGTTQPGLPALPGFPDLNPGPQSRLNEGVVIPTMAPVTNQKTAP